jgi:hypothetical protein
MGSSKMTNVYRNADRRQWRLHSEFLTNAQTSDGHEQVFHMALVIAAFIANRSIMTQENNP